MTQGNSTQGGLFLNGQYEKLARDIAVIDKLAVAILKIETQGAFTQSSLLS
ncbi:MAG: hypothetical protein IJR63_04745 [Synergistaceae bacterium]|nr:hypothetical protein [Synergistaceae bacterium]